MAPSPVLQEDRKTYVALPVSQSSQAASWMSLIYSSELSSLLSRVDNQQGYALFSGSTRIEAALFKKIADQTKSGCRRGEGQCYYRCL